MGRDLYFHLKERGLDDYSIRVEYMRLAETLEILKHLNEELVNPYELFKSNGFRFSRATSCRRLESLKQAGLIECRVGKAKLTENGLMLRSILNGSHGSFEEKKEDKGTFYGPITESHESPMENKSRLLGRKIMELTLRGGLRFMQKR